MEKRMNRSKQKVSGSLKKCVSNSKGATLVETLVATAILGILIIGITQFFAFTEMSKTKVKVKMVMERIAADISNKIKSPSVLYVSLLDQTNNSQLYDCVISENNGCTRDMLSHNERNPAFFALNYASTRNQRSQISNGTRNKLYYSVDGQLCYENNKDCIFSVDTFYYVTCAESYDSSSDCRGQCCDGPAQLHLAYKVYQIKDAEKRWGEKLPNIPEETIFYTIDTSTILSTFSSGDCNFGASITGFQETGKTSCTCQNPYIPNGNKNSRGPICTLASVQQYCGNGSIVTSIDENQSVGCTSLNPNQVYDCYTLKGYGVHLKSTCSAPGDFLRSSRRKCTFYCFLSLDKGRSDETDKKCESSYEEDHKSPFTRKEDNPSMDPSAVDEGLKCDRSQRTIECCRRKSF